jgi:hypothetical protein
VIWCGNRENHEGGEKAPAQGFTHFRTFSNDQRLSGMTKALFIALLVGGIVLTIIGINASNSFSSDVTRFFTGSPTDKAVWMLIGGVVMGIAGLVGLTLGTRRM